MRSLLVCVIPFVLAACTGKDATPSGSAAAFLEACAKGGTPTDFLQKADREFLTRPGRPGGDKPLFALSPQAAWKIAGESVDGSTASVRVTIVENGAERTESLALVKEEGRWRIDLLPDAMLRMLDGVKSPGA